jgi:hypothetical protein
MGGPADAEEAEDAEAADDCAWCGHAAREHTGRGVCEVIVANDECPCEGYVSMTETQE